MILPNHWLESSLFDLWVRGAGDPFGCTSGQALRSA